MAKINNKFISLIKWQELKKAIYERLNPTYNKRPLVNYNFEEEDIAEVGESIELNIRKINGYNVYLNANPKRKYRTRVFIDNKEINYNANWENNSNRDYDIQGAGNFLHANAVISNQNTIYGGEYFFPSYGMYPITYNDRVYIAGLGCTSDMHDWDRSSILELDMINNELIPQGIYNIYNQPNLNTIGHEFIALFDRKTGNYIKTVTGNERGSSDFQEWLSAYLKNNDYPIQVYNYIYSRGFGKSIIFTYKNNLYFCGIKNTNDSWYYDIDKNISPLQSSLNSDGTYYNIQAYNVKTNIFLKFNGSKFECLGACPIFCNPQSMYGEYRTFDEGIEFNDKVYIPYNGKILTYHDTQGWGEIPNITIQTWDANWTAGRRTANFFILDDSLFLHDNDRILQRINDNNWILRNDLFINYEYNNIIEDFSGILYSSDYSSGIFGKGKGYYYSYKNELYFYVGNMAGIFKYNKEDKKWEIFSVLPYNRMKYPQLIGFRNKLLVVSNENNSGERNDIGGNGLCYFIIDIETGIAENAYYKLSSDMQQLINNE